MADTKTKPPTWHDDPVRVAIAWVGLLGLYAFYFHLILRNVTAVATPSALATIAGIAGALAVASSGVKYYRVATALPRRRKRRLERLETVLAGSAALLGFPLLIRFLVMS